jgi:hypothetical protein
VFHIEVHYIKDIIQTLSSHTSPLRPICCPYL